MSGPQDQKIWTILSILNWATDYFTSKEISSARLDAQLLLGHVLNMSKVELYTVFDKPLNKVELADFKKLILRRANREPVAYILGSKGFWRYDFKVTPATLIPRPDTEILVEKSLVILNTKNWESPKVLDIGTGTGCLAISIALDYPLAQVDAVDISPEALKIAQQNAESLEANVNFYQSDLMTALKGKTYQLIVSNPPYISDDELKTVQPEISGFEPHLALTSPKQGMQHYERILENVGNYLTADGVLLLEIGDYREKLLTELAKKYFFHTNTHPDLNGSPRLLELTGIKPTWKQ
jgi:release factor glutamine methyltransferase